jgi:hypothetical protein
MLILHLGRSVCFIKVKNSGKISGCKGDTAVARFIAVCRKRGVATSSPSIAFKWRAEKQQDF